MARLFAALAIAGFDSFQAARVLANAGIEIDANGTIIRDPAKAKTAGQPPSPDAGENSDSAH